MAGAIRALHELGIQIGQGHLVRRLRQRAGRRATSAAHRRRVSRCSGALRHSQRGRSDASRRFGVPLRIRRRRFTEAPVDDDRCLPTEFIGSGPSCGPTAGPMSLRHQSKRDERGVDELVGQQVEVAIQVDDRPRLTEVVDSNGDHPCAEYGSEPRQGVAGGVVHRDDRQLSLMWRQERRQRVADRRCDALSGRRREALGARLDRGGPDSSGPAPPRRCLQRRARVPPRPPLERRHLMRR